MSTNEPSQLQSAVSTLNGEAQPLKNQLSECQQCHLQSTGQWRYNNNLFYCLDCWAEFDVYTQQDKKVSAPQDIKVELQLDSVLQRRLRSNSAPSKFQELMAESNTHKMFQLKRSQSLWRPSGKYTACETLEINELKRGDSD